MTAVIQVDVFDAPRVTDGQTGLRFHVVKWTGDSAYAAGGYTLTAADYHMTTIAFVAVSGATGTAGVIPVWNGATGKLMFYKGAASTTVTTGSGGLTEASTNDTYVDGTVTYLLVAGY